METTTAPPPTEAAPHDGIPNGLAPPPHPAERPRVRSAGHADQMLRQVQGIHVQYSQMADAKANMMLTVAALVIPLSVQYINNPDFHWAAITMISFCAATVALAAYAALPKLTLGPKTDLPDIAGPGFNILFFGDFTKLDYETYRSEMLEIIGEPQRTYEMQIREIYSMGMYLARQKYRFVRYAYMTFISGMLLSSAIYVFGQML